MKVLAFTTDIIPLPGLPTSGTALRTYGFVQGLRAHGHDVVVSVPRNAVAGFSDTFDLASLEPATKKDFGQLRDLAFDASNQASIISQLNPDLILCGHWPAMTLYSKPSQPVVIDLAGPHLLERHYQGSPNQMGAALGKLTAISKADYFIVSGPTQRLYFLSFLLRAEIDRPESRIVTIPMPLDPQRPPRQALDLNSYPRFVFGGVFLPWQDPSSALRQISTELTKRNKGQLTLVGGKHPNYDIKEGVYARLFEELRTNPRIAGKPLLPYSEFVGELASKDVAIDLMKWNLERQLAVTIRTTTYLWAGVPVIYNDYADLGSLISTYDAGWCVAPEDSSALHAVCNEIFENPELLRRKSANASRLAEEVFSWDTAVQPLLDLISTPAAKRLRETDIILDFPDNAELPVISGGELEQYFVCRVNGLTRIECRMATHNRTLRHPVGLALYQLEKGPQAGSPALPSCTRQLVARTSCDAERVPNNEWLALDVEPILDSAGKTFVLRVESEEKEPGAGASPWAVKGSPYPMLGLYYGERFLDHASLCFRTTCAGG